VQAVHKPQTGENSGDDAFKLELQQRRIKRKLTAVWPWNCGNDLCRVMIMTMTILLMRMKDRRIGCRVEVDAAVEVSSKGLCCPFSAKGFFPI